MSKSYYRLALGQASALRGHVHGLPQACLVLLCLVEPCDSPPAGHAKTDDSLLAPAAPGCELRLGRMATRSAETAALAEQFLPLLEPVNTLLVRLQESAGWPVAGGGVVERIRRMAGDSAGTSALLVFPAFAPAALIRVLRWAFAHLRGEPARSGAQAPDTPTSLAAALALLATAAPRGTNTRWLLKAAYERGVPVERLPGTAMQYGWGVRSRWMDSSFTDTDSVMAARFARDKRASHALLARAGLPVPAQAAAPTVEEACRFAARVGYPVVIKPADLDGGKGVEAGLGDEAALRRAYARASKHSRTLIAEKHVAGRDFRLGVLNGDLAWATYREPAGVWGDGVNAVSELIAAVNRDPLRGTQSWSQMSPITVNAEAEELLAEQGMALGDVPAAGTFVQLRRAANVSSGGRPVDVTGTVHPDNAALAVQAARVMRLGIAGVDLIIPDVARSWREVGGAICEVNGQPQFSNFRPEVPGRIIEELLHGDGRIPVIVLLGECHWGAWAEALRARLQAFGCETGFVLADGARVGAGPVGVGDRPAFDQVQALLADTRVGALVVANAGRDWLRTGMPADRVDLALCDATADPRVLRLLHDAGSECWRVDVPFAQAADTLPAWLPPLARFIERRAGAASPHTASAAGKKV